MISEARQLLEKVSPALLFVCVFGAWAPESWTVEVIAGALATQFRQDEAWGLPLK